MSDTTTTTAITFSDNQKEISISNIRSSAIFPDWPSGRKRVWCEFGIEKNSRGMRIFRRTARFETDDIENVVWCSSKFSRYNPLVAIADVIIDDADEPRTCILEFGVSHITVMDHAMKFQIASIFLNAENKEKVLKIQEMARTSFADSAIN